MRLTLNTARIRDQRDPKARDDPVFKYLVVPFMAAMFVTSSDALGFLLVLRTIPPTAFVLVIFLEGGLGLITGVAISLSSTPSASAVGEKLFGTAPWSREAERHAERVGWRLLIASTLLILLGFAVSVV